MYYSDKAIEVAAEDTLDRSNFAKKFAKTLNDLKNEETFTIGLFGTWGSGKTSIVNMALKELEELQESDAERTIVLRFDPWHFTNSTQLFNQFLIALANKFNGKKNKKLNKVGQALSQYSSAFELAELIPVPILNTVISKVGGWSAKKIGDGLQNNLESKDILKQKELVVQLLQETKQKILIVIDDIDRLDNEQIRQVFQLVSAVAKFPNTTYLLVFDKSIVVKALEKVQEGDGEDYLKKIIQVPIQIPEVKASKLFETLFIRLDKLLDNHSGIRFNEEHWGFIFKYCVQPFVGNLRDISRLTNALEFKFANIADEIDFADMVGISALEMREPKVYEWIKLNKNKLVNGFNGWAEHKKNTEEKYAETYAEIKSLLGSAERESVFIERRVQETIVAISCLFPGFGDSIGKTYSPVSLHERRKYNLICHEDKFERYFNLDVDEVVVKQSMVDKVIHLYDEKEIETTLRRVEEKGKAYELLEEIEIFFSELSEERVWVLLNGILNSIYYLESKKGGGIAWVNTSDKAEHLVYGLLKIANPSNRGEWIISLIKKAEFTHLESLAKIINMIELGFGRLAANGTERTEYGKIIQLNELEKIEKEYAIRCERVLKETSLFDLCTWRMAYHLWRSFDKDYVADYLRAKFEDDKNVISYLYELIGTWIGTGVSYEVFKQEDEYVSKERILVAIDNLLATGELFNLSEESQRRAASYYLTMNNKVEYDGHVSQKSADAWLKERKA